MVGRGSNRLTRTIAMICVAIVCVFCVQTTLIAVDRLEHAFEIEHDANPLAGTVQYCGAASDGCEQSGEPIHPISHVHSGDTATNILPGSAPSLATIDFKEATIPLAGRRVGTSVSQLAPDRPPKA